MAATKGPWLKEGNTIYALVHFGWDKGVEHFKNRFWVSVYKDVEYPEEERKANVDFIAAANPAAILALLDELEDSHKAYALLFRENAELRKDADRYRWLVAQMLNPSPGAQEEMFSRLHAINPKPENAWQVDAAIDAAKGESNAN